MERLKARIKDLLLDIGVKGDIDIIIPPDFEMGDFGFATFNLAKEQKKNPYDLTVELKEAVEEKGIPDFIDRIEAVGPYLNFFLKTPKLAEVVIGDVKKAGKKYGTNTAGKNKKVLIEYPSNNTHKELHIGHLRNICIGNALTKIFLASGFKAVPVNYLNDFGSHVAKCLWGMEKFHKDQQPPENKQRWLGEIYAEASIYLDEHPEYKQEVADLQKKLESKDKSIWDLFLKTREWSIEGFDAAFAELGVKHDFVFYEKDIKEAGQKMVDELLKKKIAEVGEGGAIIIDLKKYGLDIALLRKSDGSGLYMTSDLGLALAKQKKYPQQNESVHITGDEQDFYFKQLFKVLELAGYKFKMTHIGYGLVNLPTGKMSSRKGTVVLYEDVKNSVFNEVMRETAPRHQDWSEERINDTCKKIALGAVKFDFLKHEANKVIIFDEKSAVSFDGFTGPYVLYVVARINSLINKAKKIKNKINFELLKEPEEKQLLVLMCQYEDMIKKSLENYNPSVITKYCFDLAKQYNDFYSKHSVLGAENDDVINARLALSSSVKQVLENALGLLSIDTVEEM